MKLFACRACQQTLFFESVQCTRCGRGLAFLPDQGTVCAIELAPAPLSGATPPAGQRAAASLADGAPTWRVIGDDSERRYRLCQNNVEHGVCNWGVEATDANPYCVACRLNHMIPNLATPKVKDAWHALEVAKRRVLYTLYELGLPVEGRAERPDGLQFDFLQDGATPGQPHVYTGHADGVITINVAEAEDPFREKMRVELGESYRTVLGHLRHEIGHYYWDRLIRGGPHLAGFRALFGDEQPDYAEAQKRHYSEGPPLDWISRFVSAYASMHPWEDWAETWAHYLHIFDTLETARAYGLSLKPIREAGAREGGLAARRLDLHSFEDMIDGWIPLTVALNSLNRSMGLKDGYPFVLTTNAIEKLKFVHGVVAAQGSNGTSGR